MDLDSFDSGSQVSKKRRGAAGSAGGASRRSGSAPPARRYGSADDEVRMWLVGFPSPLLKQVLERHAKEAIASMLPLYDAARVTVKARNVSRALPIIFKSSQDAQLAIDKIAEHPEKIVQVQHGKEIFKLRLRPDRTVEQRRKLAVTGRLWNEAQTVLTQAKQFVQGSSTGTTGKKGELFFARTEDEIFILFHRP